MSVPPSQSSNLAVTENVKKADLDQSKTNGRKDPSKLVIVLVAMVVALSTIGGAWMVVKWSIDSKTQAYWLAVKRDLVMKDLGKAFAFASPDPKTTASPTASPPGS
jgi:hypothetical protein